MAVRVSRYLADDPDERHVRFSVWSEDGVAEQRSRSTMLPVAITKANRTAPTATPCRTIVSGIPAPPLAHAHLREHTIG
jgi:hypothetical protein